MNVATAHMPNVLQVLVCSPRADTQVCPYMMLSGYFLSNYYCVVSFFTAPETSRLLPVNHGQLPLVVLSRRTIHVELHGFGASRGLNFP